MPVSIRTTEATNPLAIKVSGLGKVYRVWNSPFERLAGAIADGLAKLAARGLGTDHRIVQRLKSRFQRGFREIRALHSVSFQVGRGEVVGIIGYNGSGKSTLLQILAGTMTPSAGTVEIHGRVAALLELGSGINFEFTGRENAFLYGSILGFSRAVLEGRMHAIEEFAEIGEFIDEPVKTYSSGMVARLAFSVLTQLDPDILIIDETLSVGDAYFQHKSVNLIRRFCEAGKTMLVVSHDPGTIKSMCTRGIILESGIMVREGAAASICDYYNALVAKKQRDEEIRQVEREKGQIVTRSGDRRALIGDIELLNRERTPARAFLVGEEAQIACAVEFRAQVDNPTVGVLIRDRLGNDVFGSNTFNQQIDLGSFAAGSKCEVLFDTRLNLAPGRYSVTVAAHSGRDHLTDNYDWQDNALVFEVLPGTETTFIGTAWLPLKIEVDRMSLAMFRHYSWGQSLGFGVDGNAVRYKHTGWSFPEEHFTWTDGTEAILRFDLPASSTERVLRIRAAGYCTADLHSQRADVFFDGELIAHWTIGEVGDFVAKVPAGKLKSGGRHRIRLSLPDAISPDASGQSNDRRQLGVRVFAAQID
jgi:lipopolysaccharide transport system ATP-binding protein